MENDNREWPDNPANVVEQLEALIREHPGEEATVTISVDEAGLSQLRELDGRLISIDNFDDTGELQMVVEIEEEDPHPAGNLFNVTVRLLP